MGGVDQLYLVLDELLHTSLQVFPILDTVADYSQQGVTLQDCRDGDIAGVRQGFYGRLFEYDHK